MNARSVLNEAEKHGVKVTLNAAANSNLVFQSQLAEREPANIFNVGATRMNPAAARSS
jgi:hypothetical protein